MTKRIATLKELGVTIVGNPKRNTRIAYTWMVSDIATHREKLFERYAKVSPTIKRDTYLKRAVYRDREKLLGECIPFETKDFFHVYGCVAPISSPWLAAFVHGHEQAHLVEFVQPNITRTLRELMEYNGIMVREWPSLRSRENRADLGSIIATARAIDIVPDTPKQKARKLYDAIRRHLGPGHKAWHDFTIPCPTENFVVDIAA